jgi:hypothetical protein
LRSLLAKTEQQLESDIRLLVSQATLPFSLLPPSLVVLSVKLLILAIPQNVLLRTSTIAWSDKHWGQPLKIQSICNDPKVYRPLLSKNLEFCRNSESSLRRGPGIPQSVSLTGTDDLVLAQLYALAIIRSEKQKEKQEGGSIVVC